MWLRSLTKRLTPAQYKNVVKQSEQLPERERKLAEAVIQVMTNAILLAREKQYTTVDELLAAGIEREVAEAAVKLL